MTGWSTEFKKGFFTGAGIIAAVIVVGFVLKRV
jgi:hypothetical protein